VPRAHWAGDAVYAAAERFVDECLRSDGSLFTPGHPIWTSEPIEDFYTRFFVNEDTGSGSFMDKLEQQLTGAPDATIQLAAEALYFNYLCEDDTGAAHKASVVGRVLGWMTEPAAVPEELAAAYSSGLARIGLGKTQKWQQVSFLLRFSREWKALDGTRRSELLDDHAEFREFVHSIPKHAASIQIEGLLHLVFPEPYEPIVSPNVKKLIAKRFGDYLDGSERDVDEQLRSIRAALSEEYEGDFSFYDAEVASRWQATDPGGAVGAWLVRGANAYDSNLVPRWLADGFVSMSQESDGEIPKGLEPNEIIDMFERTIPDRTREQLRNAALVTKRFVDKMKIGDLVMTLDPADLVYVGRVTGEPEWVGGDTPGTARRRSVTWLNAEDPAQRSELPESIRRLLRPSTVIDLSAVAGEVAALIPSEPTSSWDGFLHWAQRLYETAGFDETERAYKLEIAERVRTARESLLAGEEDWLAHLRRAFGSPNNLTAWRAHDGFLHDAEQDEERFRAFLAEAWSDDLDDSAVASLFERWPAENGPGNKVSLLSFLRMGVAPHDAPVYRARAVGKARGLIGDPEPPGGPAERYLGYLRLVDELRARLQLRGVSIRDRLDAQSLLWWVAEGDPPGAWGDDERQAFLEWRGDVVPTSNGEASVQARIAAVPPKLADELLLEQSWLQEIVDLLNEKRQVVFYGPPGTGKTFVGQALAKHVRESGGEFDLVQFHPAYSYEDFFEGYRPRLGSAGAVEFELRPGPLRRLADAARANPSRPFLLIVDEINRGNIAKIFGELYFLLEYRDHEIRLQYSSDELFSLPDNLFVIGTMNTADRSIALVDSALRRRFYFVGFLPTEEPLRSVLRRWLEGRGYNAEAANYLELLNDALAHSAGGDEELAIGPSYFITRDGAPDLDRIWRHAIAPLLEERFFGARRAAEIERDFSPSALLRGESGE